MAKFKGMGDHKPGAARESQTFPKGRYRFRLDEVEQTATAGKGTGKNPLPAGVLMFRLGFVCTKSVPKGFEKLGFSSFHVCGTREDPKAKKPTTWTESLGYGEMSKLLRVLGAPPVKGQSLKKRFMKAADKECILELGVEVRDGRKRNNLVDCYPVGKIKEGITDEEFLDAVSASDEDEDTEAEDESEDEAEEESEAEDEAEDEAEAEAEDSDEDSDEEEEDENENEENENEEEEEEEEEEKPAKTKAGGKEKKKGK